MTVNRRPSRSTSRLTTGGTNHSVTSPASPASSGSSATMHSDANHSPAASISELEAKFEQDFIGDVSYGSCDLTGSSGCALTPDCYKATSSPSSASSSSFTSSTHNNTVQSEADSDREANYDELKFPQPPPPKHIPFPDVPQQSEIMCELVMFVYTALAASAQFLHLYRSVWWLPESNTTQAVVRSHEV